MNVVSCRAQKLACVILAHADPVHLHRLIEALDPFPIFLHIDARTPDGLFDAMTAGLPSRCVLLKRTATGWAQWGLVAAELEGYRAALASTEATHVALFSGSDYPLATTDDIATFLEGYARESFAEVNELPYVEWGKSGGYSRLRYRHWGYGKRMLRLPIPRRLPADIIFTGGSQSKILARDHARAVVQLAEERKDLVQFWRRTWVPDETFVYSLLNSPGLGLVPCWKAQLVPTNLWWIGWGSTPRKSPPWLGLEHLELLLKGRQGEVGRAPTLFARKFATDFSTPVLDSLDARFSLRPNSVRPV